MIALYRLNSYNSVYLLAAPKHLIDTLLDSLGMPPNCMAFFL